MDSFRAFIKGWVGKIFLALICFVLVVFAFAPQFAPPGAQGEVAIVNGHKISERELEQAWENTLARYEGQLDRQLLEQFISRDRVLEDLISQRVLVDSAGDLGLVAHPALVMETIRSIEAFRGGDGQFSGDVMQRVVLANGYPTVAAFRERIEQDMLSQQLSGAIRDSAFATRQEIELLTRIGEQTRDLAWVAIPVASLLPAISVTDAEVRAHYDGNPGGYLTAEQFAMDYLEVKAADYAGDGVLDEDEVQAKYDYLAATARQNAERRVAHILVSTASRSRDEAMTRANAALARLSAGERFADVATEVSDDAGSRSKGGDLGFLGRGVLEEPLDRAVFALAPGNVSAPVESSEGVHLVTVLEISEVAVPKLADVRDEIERGLRRDRGETRYRELVDTLGTLAYEAADLAEPARETGLVVRSTGLFGRNGGPGVAGNDKVLRALFSPDVLSAGRNSQVIEVADGHAVVIRLREHRKPQRRPFEEVAGEVKQDLLASLAARRAGEQAEALRAAVAGGQSLEQAAAAAGLVYQRAPEARRNAADIPQELLAAAFRAPRPAEGRVSVDTVALADSGRAVFAVAAVVDGNMLGVPEEAARQLQGQLAGELSRRDHARFVAYATAAADVERIKRSAEEGGGLLDAMRRAQEEAPRLK